MIPITTTSVTAMNRAERRSNGAKGKFLDAGRMPSILVPYAPGWELRRFNRIDRQSARSRRTIRRMRAQGEEVLSA